MLRQRYIVSVDLGEKVDWTAIVTLDTERKRYKPVAIERMRGDSCDDLSRFAGPGLGFYDKVIRLLAWRLMDPASPICGNAVAVMDGTGPGREVVLMALRGKMGGGRLVYPVQIRADVDGTFQAKNQWILTSRKTLLGVLSNVIDQKRLVGNESLALWGTLRREAEMACVREEPGDVAHRMREHDDIVMALAQGVTLGEKLITQGVVGGVYAPRWG